MQEMMLNSGVLHMMLDTATSSRFELLMFAVSLMVYYVLHSSRHHMKGVHKKINVAFEDSEELKATNENAGAEAASVHLARVLGSMKLCVLSLPSHVCHVTTELNGFFDKYPEYPFELSDVLAILDFCSSSMETVMPDILFDRMKSTEDWQILSAFIHFYIQGEQFDKACDIFELKYSTFFDIELDERMEWSLIMAALQCKRQTLAEHLLQTSQTNAAKQIMTVQKWWKRRAADLCESRVERMGSVLNRLSSVFNERFPFEDEHSDGESTCFLGDDSECEDSSDDESWCDEVDR